VDDDGVVGTVTIGAVDGEAVEEAKRRIMLILDPPTADVGAVYQGKVVNTTAFGAFINILPGRDGLLHISKMSPLADGKRVNKVEDVVELGQDLEVRVDEIDPKGKISLSLANAPAPEPREPRESREPRGERAPREERSTSASFEDAFEQELTADLGDLGPGGPQSSNDGNDRRRSRNRSRRN
jgi:polyribonucleotide nucleotidyltransferase